MTNLSGANLNNGAAVGPQGEGRDSPSRFPKYPAYKDSGVEWLGEVPDHWEVGSLRRLIKSVGNGTTADQVDEAEDTVAVSRIETISTGKINFEKVGHVVPQDVARRFLLNAGDILFSHINSLSMVGNVAIYSGGRPLLHGMNLLRIQPLPSISSEWLLYWLKSKNVRQEVESRAKPAINQASISTDSVRALPALIPPSFEQTQIARFLDHETARIDALIEEQQHLIELLKEKRQAVISRAVTKGLDPTVPMKDSGVEWLGAVPAHWVVKKLKREIIAQSGTDQKYDGGDFPLFGANGVIGETNTTSIQSACVLIGRVGSAGEINFISQAAGVSDNALIVSNQIFNAPRYDFYLFHAMDIKSSVSKNAQPLITASSFRDRIVAVPMDVCERLQIARFLDHESARIDALIEEAQKGVTLLQERRSALISAAVTGKIDVRGWQPPVSTQAHESAVAEAV